MTKKELINNLVELRNETKYLEEKLDTVMRAFEDLKTVVGYLEQIDTEENITDNKDEV